MRVLALDIGDVRVGLASGDTDARIAMPLQVVDASQASACSGLFKRIVEDHEPELLVVGLPKTMSGEEGPQAAHVRSIAEPIGSRLGLDIVYVDERLSSEQAKRILREQGLNEKQMRGRVDSVAASLFLQVWLDSRARET